VKFEEVLLSYGQRIDNCLLNYLPNASEVPTNLHQAMHYVVFNGGKRIRPTIIYVTAQALNLELTLVDPIACAIELIHAYSLVHDDLPAMDDDDLRRGKATCHIAFDEAIAILAGDALQALAFEIISAPDNQNISAETRVLLTHCIAEACGSSGMVGGQTLDLNATDQQMSLENLEEMHSRKTGALIRSCVNCCLLMTKLNKQHKQNLMEFSYHLGLAFQIKDDILDVEGTTDSMGKTQGADADGNKATYVSILGLDGAKEQLALAYAKALKLLDGSKDILQKGHQLSQLTEFIVKRHH